MAEQDELRLTITAVDQASPVLKDLSAQIQAISGGAAKNNLDQFRSATAQAHVQFKTFGEDIKKASEQIIPPFIRGIGGIATGFVGMAFAAERGLEMLKNFSKEVISLNAAAASSGVNLAQFRGMIETMQRSGVDAATAQSNIQGLAHSFGELQKAGSQFRQELLQKAGLQGQEDMQRWLVGMSKADFATFANEVKEKSEEIYTTMYNHQIAMGRSVDAAATAAANAKRHFLEAFGAPDLEQLIEQFRTATDEEKKLLADRLKAAQDFMKVSADISIQWDHITAGWKTDAMKAFLPLVQQVDTYMQSIAGSSGATKGFWDEVAATIQTTLREIQAIVDLIDKIKHPAILDVPPATWEDWRKSWGLSEGAPGMPKGSSPPAKGSTGAAGKPLSVPHYQEGGFVPHDTLAQVHAGEIIHPREGADAMKEQTKQTRELAEQMKRLNDWLQMSAAVYGGGGVAPAGGAAGGVPASAFSGTGGMMRLGGLPAGLGAGPMARSYAFGGGAYGGGGTGPAVNYPGRPGGEGGSYGGGSTSGGTSDPAVPGDILETAKHAALTGGPGAVDAFMRSQGYPKSGNWCGEFAASVVKAAGGTPPKNPAIASSWRNWGLPDQTPHAGDVAVANRGVPTGATGSHVTFVENVDPKTGRFTGLGGNQGAGPESGFRISDYTFRRSVGGKAGLPNGSDVGPGAGAGAGETPAGSPSEYLARQRAGFAAELKDPAKRALFEDVIAHEGGSVAERAAVAEAAMNRAAYKGISLGQDIHSGFYGPVNRGEVTGRPNAVNAAISNEAINRVLAGSNIVHGATDQGMAKEIHSAWREQHGDWFGDITPGAASWRERQQREAMTHRVEGSGTIDVNVNAPRGTFVKAAGRGMFKSTKINRQMQMERAASSVPYEE
jgi:uncharacterized protein (TIGR02594 family)